MHKSLYIEASYVEEASLKTSNSFFIEDDLAEIDL